MTDEQKKLVEDNIRLASYMAHKWINKGVKNFTYDEIFSMFSMGLCKAARAFDPNYGSKFATFAARCMENELKMAFRKAERNQCMEINLSTTLNVNRDGNELKLQDVINNEDHLDYDDVLEMMCAKEAVKLLSERDLKIIKLRYFYNVKQRQVAEILKVSQSYVSRLESRILKKLRHWDKDQRKEVS